AARRVVASLPPGSAAGVALRIVRPFGDRAAIDQLVLELRPGSPSPGLTIRRADPPAHALAARRGAAPRAPAMPKTPAWVVAVVVAIALASAWILASAR
ncbi:MAG TPA: hypothetical protein VHB21_04040, partial [Minicystis sp.]|nr:hypothetical protein [Minicystis sp.]